MKLLIVLAALTGLAGQAAQDEAPQPWQGIWQGTLGDQTVRVCLVSGAYSFGAYFYDRYRRVINLERPDEGDVWIEGDNRDPARPRWTIAMNGAELTGRWTRGTTSLPIRLTRLAGPALGDERCGSLTFNRPRLTPARIVSRRAAIDGVAYSRLTAEVGSAFPGVSIRSFALDGRDPATGRINAALAQPLPGDPAASEWFECVRGNLDMHGADGGYQRLTEPVMVTARWLVTRDYSDTYCGGNHPNTENRARIFDRSTGAEINLHDWLSPRVVSRSGPPGSDEESITLAEPFRRLIIGPVRRTGGDSDAAECRDVMLRAEYWIIGLTRGGLTFTPDLPRVVMACGDTFELSFARLAPYLSAQGRAGAASLGPAARPARRR